MDAANMVLGSAARPLQYQTQTAPSLPHQLSLPSPLHPSLTASPSPHHSTFPSLLHPPIITPPSTHCSILPSPFVPPLTVPPPFMLHSCACRHFNFQCTGTEWCWLHHTTLVIFQSDINYSDVIVWFVILGVGLGLANLLGNIHSLGHPAKHSVFVVQPGLGGGGEGKRQGRDKGVRSIVVHMARTQPLPHKARTQPLPHKARTQPLPHKARTQPLPHKARTQPLPPPPPDHTLTVGAMVMKNWEPLVLGPALAMLTVKGRSCFSDGWNSSSNSPPQMDSPPVPVPARQGWGGWGVWRRAHRLFYHLYRHMRTHTSFLPFFITEGLCVTLRVSSAHQNTKIRRQVAMAMHHLPVGSPVCIINCLMTRWKMWPS